jgi:hypothetical protein
VCFVWALAGCTGLVTTPAGQGNASAGAPAGVAGSSAAGGTGTVPVAGGHEPLVPVAPAMRRLTARQYQNSVHDIFGPEVTLTKSLETDETNERFSSLGAAKVTTSPRGVEQYRDAALELAELVQNRKNAYPELASCAPLASSDPCLSNALRSFGSRLFRRPLSDSEVARYVGVATANGDQQLGLGLRYALAALLQSPSFLYTPESGEESAGVLRYTSYEMATRLAYFLWDSTPDAALLGAATSNGLVDEAGLTEQVTRMLSAERARGLASRFFGEAWNVSRLTAQSKSVELFPEWTGTVVAAARAEFEAFLADLTAQRKADLRELFTGSSGFPSAGLTPIYGSVTQSGTPTSQPLIGTRTGLLTSAAVIAANSPTDRTSPTYRGVFVLERVLCEEPPPPPANVSTELPADPSLPLRQRLEQHRADPACKACHGLFDPLGLTFEGFDAIGRERTLDAGQPVDTSGTFGDKTFTGVKDLAAYLASDPRTERCFAHQLSDYATGHAETPGEAGVVNSLRDALVGGGYRFDSLVQALTKSPSFRYLAKPE